MGSIFFLTENYDIMTYINNCSFYENDAEMTLIDCDRSQMDISFSYFENNRNTSFYLTNSKLTISDIIFQSHKCLKNLGCLFSINDNSNFSIKNSSLNNIINFKRGNIYIENSDANFECIIIQNITTILEKIGACFLTYNSNISISSSFLYNYSFNCIYSYQTKLKLEKTSFVSKLELYEQNNLGAIFCLECIQFIMKNCSHQLSYYSDKGSCLELSSDIHVVEIENFVISDSYFSNNSANLGGAINIYNINITIINCVFKHNLAIEGGAIFLSDERKIIYFLINKSNLNLKEIYI